MYEVRGTIWKVRARCAEGRGADRVCLCTMTHSRRQFCTIWEIPALVRELGEVCRLAGLLPLAAGNA